MFKYLIDLGCGAGIVVIFWGIFLKMRPAIGNDIYESEWRAFWHILAYLGVSYGLGIGLPLILVVFGIYRLFH